MNQSITIFFDEKDKQNIFNAIDTITVYYEWFAVYPMPFFVKYINKHFHTAYIPDNNSSTDIDLNQY